MAYHQPPELPPVPVRKRRKRDYVMGLVGGNFFIVVLALGLACVAPGVGGVIVVCSGAAGMVIFSAGLTWVMFVVGEDY